MLVDRELVVDEGVDLPLHDLEDGGGFLVEDEHLGLLEMGLVAHAWPVVPFFTATLRPAWSRSVTALTGESLPTKRQRPVSAYGSVKSISILRTLRRTGEGGNDEVDLARLEGGNETVEGEVLDLQLPAESLGDGLGEIDERRPPAGLSRRSSSNGG